MIDLVVRSFIGEWGGWILDFYLQYSLWINALILGYFLVVVVSRRNFTNILYAIVQKLVENQGNFFKGKNPQQIERLINKMEIPWEAGMKASFIPFITPPRSLWPYIKNIKSFEKLYTRSLFANVLYNMQINSTNLKEN